MPARGYPHGGLREVTIFLLGPNKETPVADADRGFVLFPGRHL